MNCKKLFLPVLTLFILPFMNGCALFRGGAQIRGPVLERWQNENKKFKIRGISYEETGADENGTYYQFQSATVGSNEWHEVMSFRHDDRPKIPTDQVRFVNNDTAYIFMGWKYAVTTDAAQSWSVWTAERDLPNWQCCNYSLIADVTIANDGNGIMRLNPIEDRRGEVSLLRTTDYGRHWKAE